MADERDELTPAQQLLGAALSLNEAIYELMALAQTPEILDRLVAAQADAVNRDADEPPFAEIFDKIAEGLCNLFHAAGQPEALEPLATAASRWVRGDG